MATQWIEYIPSNPRAANGPFNKYCLDNWVGIWKKEMDTTTH